MSSAERSEPEVITTESCGHELLDSLGTILRAMPLNDVQRHHATQTIIELKAMISELASKVGDA